jgi:imidazolonepropionase-like amidohydrolase
MTRHLAKVGFSAALVSLLVVAPRAQAPTAGGTKAPVHAKQVKRLLIKNAMVIYGNAKPPFGPVDILAEDGLIAKIGNSTSEKWPEADMIIDATGKYVMPGIVNTHMHWHEERQPGIAQPIQYERNLYLAAGVTTAREVGGDFDKSKRWQA